MNEKVNKAYSILGVIKRNFIWTKHLFYFIRPHLEYANSVWCQYKRRYFKNRLRKHWSNQDVLFNFYADITGIGGLPICMGFSIIHDAGNSRGLPTPVRTHLIGLDYKFKVSIHFQ